MDFPTRSPRVSQLILRLVIFICVFIYVLAVRAVSLHIGEYYKLAAYPPDGYITSSSWSSNVGGALNITDYGEGVCLVSPAAYFSGTATVECFFTYTYVEYDYKGRAHNHVGYKSQYFSITCVTPTLTMQPSQLTLQPGESAEIKAIVRSGGQNRESLVLWTTGTSYSSVIETGYSEGTTLKIKGMSPGTETVTANIGGGLTATCTVTVRYKTPESITLPKTKTIKVGEQITLTPTLYPSDAQATYTWSSDNNSVSTVSNSGVVTAKKTGKARITVTTQNGKTDYCDVTVEKGNLTLAANKESGLYAKGTSVSLTANFADANIYYTLDGSTPTESSTRYTGPIAINENLTLKAVAMGSEYNQSSMVTKKYEVTTLKATAYSPTRDTTTSNAYIEPSITFNEEIREHTAFDDTTISSEGTEISGKFIVEGNVLTFIPENGELADGTYTLMLPQGAVSNPNGQPNFADTFVFTVKSEKLTLAASSPAGVIIKGTAVTLKANFADAEIYYTLDGKTPTRESSRYTTPIIIEDNAKLMAMAVGTKYRNSNVLTVDYIVTDLATTEIVPANGSKQTDMYAKLCVSFNDEIKAGIGFTNIKLKRDNTDISGRFAIKGETLFFEPTAGKMENGTYTLIVPDNAVLNKKNKPNTSFTNNFTIERKTAVVKADILSGIIESGTKVKLTATPSDAKIYYTIDGREPSVKSTLYIDPVTVSHNMTLKAIAIGENYDSGETLIGEYRLKNTLNTTAFSPESNSIIASKHSIPTVTFSEPIWRGSAFESISLKDDDGNKISGEAIVQGNQLYFVANKAFKPGTYKLETPSNALSNEVSNPCVNISSNFIVGDDNDRIELLTTYSGRTYFIKEDNSLWGIGNGLLGDGYGSEKGNRTEPVKIMENVKSVELSSSSTFIIKQDGSLWGWGANYYGELGNGDKVSKSSPVKIMDNVEKIVAYSNSVMALKTDGTLWHWGEVRKWEYIVGNWEDYHEYTLNTTPVLTPKRIMTGVKDFASDGGSVFYIIKYDYSLWSWGNCRSGLLGDGITKTTANRSTPKKILDNVKYCTYDVGAAFALKNDGTLWVWGQSYKGKLGDGLKENQRYTPYRIMDNVVSYHEDGDFSWALKKDNTIWTWGVNYSGKNALGSLVTNYYPQKVAENVSAIYNSSSYYYILDRDGVVWRYDKSNQQKTKLAENIKLMAAGKYVDNEGSLFEGDNMKLVFKAAPIAPNISALELASNKLTVMTGHKAYVALNLQPADTDYQTISFSSSNPQVATVSETGIVTGLKEGTSVISVNVDGKFKKTCEVTVTDNFGINIIPTQSGKLEAKKPSAKKGENVVLTVMPDEEFELDSVCIIDGYSALVNYTIKENSISFTMPSSDVRITSAFKPIKYSITVSDSKDGNVTPSVQKAASGEIVTLAISPSEDFVIDKCTITDKKGEAVEYRAYGHTIEFSMPGSDVTITPTFRENVYTVKTEDVDNGEVIILPEKGAKGETISILLNPNKNYYFEGVNAASSDGKDIATDLLDNIATFLMPHSDVAVNAVFMTLGDLNKDGIIDISDMVLTINHVLGKTVQDGIMAEKMDLNGDGQVDVGDVILIVKAILAQGGRVEVPAEARGTAKMVDLKQYTAMQLNVTVPMGTEIADIQISGHNRDTHQLMYQKTGDNSYSLVIYSLDNQTFSNVEGSLLKVTLDGEGDPVMSNVLLSTPTGERTFVGSMPMGTATGISTIGTTNTNSNAIYDLRGNKVQTKDRLQKGVYIMNGKKVIK